MILESLDYHDCINCNNLDIVKEAMDAGRKEEAIRFAEWISKNDYRTASNGHYCKLNGSGFIDRYPTSVLYDIFYAQQPKKP